MKDRRKEKRLKELNEVTVSVVSEGSELPKGEVPYHYSEDISVSGSKIRGAIYLPVDTLLKIDFKLKQLEKQISALGKIRWIKLIIKDKYYEAGIEFVDTPSQVIQKIQDYIVWKQKNKNLKPLYIFAKYDNAEENSESP